MVFSSYAFLFFFLPIALAGFWLLDRRRLGRARLGWLLACSLFFYAYWNPVYLPLLLGSMAVNFALGRAVFGRAAGGERGLLGLGIAFNLALLGYFKYANFLVDNANLLLGSGISVGTVVLPLAISFFTFQQIAYLVDSWRGTTEPHGPLPYAVFVSFFPQLIAGPIIRHSETIPQLDRPDARFSGPSDLAVGSALFTAGLFKKMVLADGMGGFSDPVFDAALGGASLPFFQAWGGALAGTLQLYFDFSGYTDMAIGAARLFGIRLPVNFASPYRAPNIIELWRRWHITLSTFLRDYLYIPLGGNRRGSTRRTLNLLVTMLLGGLWHGASWTFVCWGGLHGAFLIVNHAWRALPFAGGPSRGWQRAWNRTLTFLCFLVAYVVFRAESLEAAGAVYQGMLGVHGLDLAASPAALPWGQLAGTAAVLVAACAGPNSQEVLRDFEPVLGTRPLASPVPLLRRLAWRPTAWWAAGLGLVALSAILLLDRAEEFIYFQF